MTLFREILRNMLDCAVAWGHRPEPARNACTDTIRYCRPPRGPMLRADDLADISVTLRHLEIEPSFGGATVRLILFTRCATGEISRSCWFQVKPDRLAVIHAKTGPRHVLLGEAARQLLDSLADATTAESVFSDHKRNEFLSESELYRFLKKTRDAAGTVADAWPQIATFISTTQSSTNRPSVWHCPSGQIHYSSTE